MPTPTGIWYHWILLFRSASPSRCENRGRFFPGPLEEEDDERGREDDGSLWVVGLKCATRRTVGLAAQLAHRAGGETQHGSWRAVWSQP